jgi:hypothetical protein
MRNLALLYFNSCEQTSCGPSMEISQERKNLNMPYCEQPPKKLGIPLQLYFLIIFIFL